MTAPSQSAEPPHEPVPARRGRRMALWITLLVLVASCAVVLGVRAVSAAHSGSHGSTPTAGPPPVTAPDADNWRRLPGRAPLSHRWFATVTSVDGRLVFFGGIAPVQCPTGSLGCMGRPRTDGAVYDPVAMTWTRMAAAPAILASPQAWAVDGSRLVYLSGRGYPQVVTYDVRSDTWRTLPPPLVQLRGNDLLAAGGGYAYVADEDDSGDGTQGQVQRVSLATGRWTLLPPSEDPSRLAVRRLFVTPDGLLMAGLHGLDPADHDYRAQVEVLRGRHWQRYVSPDIQAAGYDFAWAHASLSVPFPESQAPGRSLDPVTGKWRSLPRQPGVAEGGWQWSPGQDAVTAGGDLVLSHGVVFDVATQRSVTLSRPAGATRSGSGVIVSGGVYVLDAHSRLWWQRL